VLGGVARRASLAARNAVERRAVVEIFVHGEIAVHRRLLGQITDGGLGGARVLEQVVSGDRDAPLTRREVAGEHLHGGGLAGAVRPEKAQHLALPHLEADILDGLEWTVETGQTFDLKQGTVIHGDSWERRPYLKNYSRAGQALPIRMSGAIQRSRAVFVNAGRTRAARVWP
jgi:hypothetical protein